MRFITLLSTLGIMVLLLAACGPAATEAPQATPTTLPAAQGSAEAGTAATSAEPTPTSKYQEVVVGDEISLPVDPSLYPMVKPGPYHAGKLSAKYVDASRKDRPVPVTVWYPALLPEGSSGSPFQVGREREPDPSGAPYPLILSSSKVAALFAPYLVSHGFTWASVDGIDSWDLYDAEMIEQPFDILYALDQVADNPPEELEGMIDAERTGAIGYSFDGYNAFVLGGARIDPEFYLAQCASADATAEAVLSVLPNRYQCALAGEWDEFAAQAGEAVTASEDGLWQPITDDRIRAVMPLAGEGWMLFGEKGLTAIDRPCLLIVSTEDIWYPENVVMLEYIGADDKALISFVGRGHMMINDEEMVARMAHFAVAFFGHHLQGREDLAQYYSEEFVAHQDDLAWGVYEGE